MNDALHVPEQFIVPVKLTTELLIKAGFEDKGLSLFRHKESMVEMWNVNNHYFRGYYRDSRGIVADTTYVHQLQNLYFALTGNELEITI